MASEQIEDVSLMSERAEEKCNEQKKFTYEIKLERQATFLTFRWNSATKVKINQITNCLEIENDDYFSGKIGNNQSGLPLKQCTITIKHEPAKDSKDEAIQHLVIKHKKLPDSGLIFRLPEKEQQDVKEREKFSMFALTLRHCGSGFDTLQRLLSKWNESQLGDNEQKNGEAELNEDVIKILINGFNYEQYEARHKLNRYVDLITNMDDKVIKAVQAILDMKHFAKDDAARWTARCDAALKLQNEWDLLLPTIRVHLDKILMMAKYSSLKSKSKKKLNKIIQEYEQIQSNLREVSECMQRFLVDTLSPQMKEWMKIYKKYQEKANEERNYFLWFAAIMALAAVVLLLIAIFVPPLGIGFAGGAAATAAATGTGTTVAASGAGAAIASAAVGGIGVISGVIGGCKYMKMENRQYREVKNVTDLWNKFRKKYVKIMGNVEFIGNKSLIIPGVDDIAPMLEDSIKDIQNLAKQCMDQIEKINK